MNAAIIALVGVSALPPNNASTPPVNKAVQDGEIQVPSEPKILETAGDEVLQPDGARARWASVTYVLHGGYQAEAFVEIDEHGRGDALIYVDGEALMHVTVDDHGATKTWVAPNIDLPPEALAQLTTTGVATEIAAGIIYEPLSFPCSDYGKKVVKVAKHIWGAMIAASSAACCLASSGAGCLLCAGAGSNVAELSSEAFDDYCQ